MKHQANLQKAIALMTNVRVPANITRQLQSREIVQTGDRMQVVKMPIAEFLAWVSQVGPIQVQRNDAYRLKNNLAKHLSDFLLPQGQFAVIYLDNKFYLVDGNTRKRAWLNCKGLKLPSHVFVNVMIPENLDEGKVFYDCYDSNQSKKSVRDEVTSMLANAGVNTEELISKLVGGGKLVTVVQYMAKAYFAKNSKVTRQEIIKEYVDEFVALDKLNLDEGLVPMSAVWAALRLYKEIPEGAGLIDDYVNEVAKLRTKSANLVCDSVRNIRRDARQACEAVGLGTTGSAPCGVMFPVYLGGFLAYLKSFSKTSAYSKTHLNKLVRKVKVVIESEQIM